MIIITGTGRSGTSMLMQFLQKTGRDDIKGKWFPKANAGLEEPMIRNATYKIVSGLQIKSKIQVHHEIKATKGYNFTARFYKDPRFFQLCGETPELIDVWKMIVPTIKFLITVRDYRKAEQSYRETFKLTQERMKGRQLTAPQLKKSHEVFMSKMEELKIPCYTIKFPDFVYDYQLVKDAFGHFNYEFKDWHEKTWYELADKNLIHF